ncbi:MAG: hypothetical protein ACI9I0_001756, partial [Rhodoferax sp.]
GRRPWLSMTSGLLHWNGTHGDIFKKLLRFHKV